MTSDINTVLTEEALLAMPEEDYLNDVQLAFFKRLLTTQKEEIIAEVAAAREQISTLDSATDPIDAASDQESLQTSLRVIERRGKLLNKIEEALSRIDMGEYGYCEESGEPIGLRRLLARPTATMSIQAKEHAEFFEKTAGVSTLDDDE